MNTKIPIFIKEDIYQRYDMKKDLQKYFGGKCHCKDIYR